MVQYNTSVFCNPCDNNSVVTTNCSPYRCQLLNMQPQYQVKIFDEDLDGVMFFIVGGNDNRGWPAFQLHNVTGMLSTSVLVDYEPGPRFYGLQIALQDNGTKIPGPQRTIVTVNITVLDLNDPPLLTSPNVTSVENNVTVGTIFYRYDSFDEDGDTVTCGIISGQVELVPPRNKPGGVKFAVNATTCELYVAGFLFYVGGTKLYQLNSYLSDGKVRTSIILTVIVIRKC